MPQNMALRRRSVSTFRERQESCSPLEQLRTQSPPLWRKNSSADQVQQHSETENCWVMIDGQVWDVAEFGLSTRAALLVRQMLGHLFYIPQLACNLQLGLRLRLRLLDDRLGG